MLFLPSNSIKKNLNCSSKIIENKYKFQNSLQVTKHKINQGFTLIEIIITIAIASILVSIAVPSLNDFIVKMRIDNEVSQLNRLILIARNNAISMEQRVVLCPLSDGGVCTNNWSNQLSVFIDLDRSGTYAEAIDTLLKVKSATESNDVITYLGQNNVTFAPTGALFSGSSTFLYCTPSDLTLGKGIVLSISGRAYLTRDNNNDGIDELRNGTNVVVSC